MHFKEAEKADVDGFDQMSEKMEYRVAHDSKGGWRMRCLPYFYVAGFSKCGSTDLFWALTTHPQITQPLWKEFPYWSRRRWNVSKIYKKQWKAKRNNSEAYEAPSPRFNSSNWYLRVNFSSYVDMFDAAADKIRTSTTYVNNSVYHSMITGELS